VPTNHASTSLNEPINGSPSTARRQAHAAIPQAAQTDRTADETAEIAMLPTDHFLWGTTVPAGEHIVELQNEPLSLRLSLPISCARAIVVLGVFT